MADCDRFLYLISAYIDGELDADSEQELRKHLATCPECRSLFETLSSISDEMSGDLSEPPPELLQTVMQSIREKAGFPLAAKRKNSSRTRRLITRYTAAAACVALILIAVPSLVHLGKSSGYGDGVSESYNLAAAPSASFYDADSSSYDEPVGMSDSVPADRSKSILPEPESVKPAFHYAMDNSASDEDLVPFEFSNNIAASNTDLLQFPLESEPAEGTAEYGELLYKGSSYKADKSLYKLVITVSGKLPDYFSSVSFTEQDGGLMALVDSGLAEKFAETNTESNIQICKNNTAAIEDPALIIITH